MPPTIPPDRIHSIDALRAVAALIVLFAHAWPAVMGNDGYVGAGFFNFLNDAVFQRGQLGVTLFFVISGYVIPPSLIRHSQGNLRRFAIARFMRLYPAYWLSAGVFVLLIGMPAESQIVWFNLTMIQRLFSVPDLIGIYWTLFIELIFYGLTALFFTFGWLATGRKVGLIVIAFLALTIVSAALRRASDLPLPAGTMMFLCLMFFGTWLRLGTYDNRRLTWATTLFLAGLLVSAALLYYPDRFGAPWYMHFSRYLWAVILFLIGVKVLKAQCGWLTYLGVISYSIYLLHQPIITFVGGQLVLSANVWSRLGAVATIMVVTCGCAAVIYRMVEWPSIELGKTINKWMDERSSPKDPIKVRGAL